MIIAIKSSHSTALGHSELFQWQRLDHRVKDDLMSDAVWVIRYESLWCRRIRDVVDSHIIQTQQKRIWLLKGSERTGPGFLSEFNCATRLCS